MLCIMESADLHSLSMLSEVREIVLTLERNVMGFKVRLGLKPFVFSNTV